MLNKHVTVVIGVPPVLLEDIFKGLHMKRRSPDDANVWSDTKGLYGIGKLASLKTNCDVCSRAAGVVVKATPHNDDAVGPRSKNTSEPANNRR
ncbi:hypothetical protein EYF80_047755 [Liparis tanakae]|uniref:Uncharacterized protein n=1 Tax=Liparis tanakae TaxID=230148 RepID=A0A4Z2FMD6_9TELE|nr:hypothetical protein EYF80_047755 [Liparis tanakae]